MQVDVLDASVSFGDRAVLANVRATFPTKAVSALVGPSGSGKSTLLAAIAGYQLLDSGRIEIAHDDGSSTSPDPSFVAWVPQGLNAIGARSALDNVMIATLSAGSTLDEARVVAEVCLSKVGLEGKAGQEARTLSGGELQRLGLARALASGKPIILADEPSANLDAANAETVASILNDLSGYSTIIVATHDHRLLSGVDYVVDLNEASWR